MDRMTRLRDGTREKLQDPVAWTEVIQIVQTVIAAVVAWVLGRARVRAAGGVPGALVGAARRARDGVTGRSGRASSRSLLRSWA